uniref:G-rich RNA sequence binding factor 1 n=1 Tax=Nomascus leucogenys TaxID=61853 RepID=A0A2I3HFH8_NOMLE
MAGTRWVLGALLRGCGSGVSGRRRLLLLLGAAAAAASQTRGLQTGPVPPGRLAGPPPVATSAAAAAAASYPVLRAPLLPQSLAAAAAAGPTRSYSQVRGRCEGPGARPLPGRAHAPPRPSVCASRARPGIRDTRRTPAPVRPVLLLGPGTREALPGVGFSPCFVLPSSLWSVGQCKCGWGFVRLLTPPPRISLAFRRLVVKLRGPSLPEGWEFPCSPSARPERPSAPLGRRLLGSFAHTLLDCRIRNGENGIHFLLNRDGKRRGDALIEMESEQDVQKALEKHRMYMGQRYVEVYEINNEDVDALMKSLEVKSSPVVNDGVVRLRGLPYSCNEKDIVDFFAGLNIVDITFVMDYRGRRKTGEAYVQFEEPEMANQALLKHREEIGNRYIEIFPSRRNEVRTHVGSYKGKKITSFPTAKYITEPEMVFEEHEVNEDIQPMTAFESEKEIELPKEVPEKLPEAADFGTTSSLHFVHVRGLPFQANAQDIINFFAPLKPVRITMEYSSSGKATGEADVHFETHEDAVAAMLKDRSHVHHRYIELFLNSCPKGK